MQIPDFKFLDPDVGIYLYYAGRDRKYMALSRAQRAVFLDIPGFLTDKDTFESDEAIIRSLNRSAAVRKNLRSPDENPAAQALSTYPTSVPFVEDKVDRSFSADLGNVRTLYVELKVGDVIIMTPQNHYDYLLIGEVASEWHEDQVMELPDRGGNPIPYREVNWLSHDLTRRDFSTRAARRMQNRKAISRFDRELYDDIFKLIYHRYIWGNVSKIDLFAPSYLSSDPTVTLESSFLIKYAVASYAAMLKGEERRFAELPLMQAANEYFDAALVVQIAQAFGSPGGYLIKLIGTGAALVVAAYAAMALADESLTETQVKQNIAVEIESARRSTPENIQVNWDAIHRSVTVGRVDELRAQYGREAKAKLGLTMHGNLPPQLTATDSGRELNND